MIAQSFTGYLSNKTYGESIVMCIAEDAGFFKGTSLNEKLSKGKGPFIDLGCAVGNELSAFQKEYPSLMTIGIDINENYLFEASKNSPKSQFIKADLFHIPLPDDSVPILFSSRIFQLENEGRNAEIVLGEAYRILKPSDKGIYIMLCEDFTEKEYHHFLNQVKNTGFEVLKEDKKYGMILQKRLSKTS